jgi:hypothetical protein
MKIIIDLLELPDWDIQQRLNSSADLVCDQQHVKNLVAQEIMDGDYLDVFFELEFEFSYDGWFIDNCENNKFIELNGKYIFRLDR